jgi:hypothetical protein
MKWAGFPSSRCSFFWCLSLGSRWGLRSFGEGGRSCGARWPGKAAASLTALATGLLFLTPQGVWAYWAAVASQFGAALYYLAQQARRRTPEAAGPEIPANRRP